MFRVILRSAATIATTGFLIFPAKAVEVYLFKGAGDFSFVNENMHFSRGLERIAEQMNAEGIHAEVRRFGAIDDALRTIRKRKPESVAFIGHSMGALASMNMARKMREEGIRVAYIGLIDIPGPVGVAGDNVEWAENFYSIHPVYGRFTNVNSHPRAENIHVGGYIHNRMDDSPEVQQRLLSAIRQVHASEQIEAPLVTPVPTPASPTPVAQPQIQHVQAVEQPQIIAPSQDVQTFAPENSDVALTYTPPAPDSPYQLPSVRPQMDVGVADPSASYATPQDSPGQLVDPVTTATVVSPVEANEDESLFRRVGRFLRERARERQPGSPTRRIADK